MSREQNTRYGGLCHFIIVSSDIGVCVIAVSYCCVHYSLGIVCVNGCLISVTGQDSGAGSPCRGGQKKDVTDGATQTGK